MRKLWTAALSISLCWTVAAGAAETHVVDGVVEDYDGAWFYVGNADGGNLLIVTNQGVLNTTNAIIGGQAASTYNTALVTGTGSQWNVTGTNPDGILRVGQSGGHNDLLIEDGGLVTVGFQLFQGWTSPSNRVVVDGAGSELRTPYFNIGHTTGGDYNEVIITNGGLVNLTGGVTFRVGAFGSSSHNSLLITGEGSRWSGGNMDIGRSADTHYNTVTVEDGGRLAVALGYIGYEGDHNSLTVRDSGSSAEMSSVLYVGQGSTNRGSVGNTLTVAGGATLTNAAMIIGHHGGSDSNRVVVDNGKLHSRNYLYFHEGANNSMLITNNATLINDGHARVGVEATATNNRVVVDGTASTWTSAGDFVVGWEGSHNTVEIRNGGTIHQTTYTGMNVGIGLSNDFNTLRITGAGSAFTSAVFTTHLGKSGSFNELLIEDGGRADMPLYLAVGFDAGAENNRVLVDGAGSELDVYRLFIGNDGANNTLVVTNGAEAIVGYARSGGGTAQGRFALGYGSGSTNNRATVSGPGAYMSAFEAFIGYNGSDNIMTVSDGARFHVEMGTEPPSGVHTPAVDELEIGVNGDRNVLRAEGGSTVSVANANAYIGRNAGATANRMEIDGEGSLLRHEGGILYIGNSGSFNSLTLDDQARAELDRVYVGNGGDANSLVLSGGASMDVDGFLYSSQSANSHGTTVTVTGAGTTLDIAGSLRGGHLGSGERFTISDGGVVTNSGSDIWFYGHTGNTNRLVIEGSGSMLYTAGGFQLGAGGSGNMIIVTNGGQIRVGNLRAGYGATAMDNRILVTGAGSLFESAGHSVIGRMGDGQRVRIEDGGRATFGELWVSEGHTAYQEFFAHDNEVLITGTGSSLGTGNLYLGGTTASTARVIAEDGATARSANVYVGHGVSSTGNYLRVSGTGSIWTNTGAFFVGYGGAEDNRLQVQDGGLLESDTLEIGAGGSLELSNATVFVGAAADPFVLQDGGLLRGSGRIETDVFSSPDPVFIDGTVSPGFSIGTLTFEGDLILGENAVVIMEIAGDEDFDRIIQDAWGEGALTFNGTLQLSLLGGYEPELHDSFQLFTADSYLDLGMVIDDTDAPLQEAWWSWQLNNDGSVSVIPEAATSGTMLLGLGLIAALRRYRHARDTIRVAGKAFPAPSRKT